MQITALQVDSDVLEDVSTSVPESRVFKTEEVYSLIVDMSGAPHPSDVADFLTCLGDYVGDLTVEDVTGNYFHLFIEG